jgi:hypothetical protein
MRVSEDQPDRRRPRPGEQVAASRRQLVGPLLIDVRVRDDAFGWGGFAGVIGHGWLLFEVVGGWGRNHPTILCEG